MHVADEEQELSEVDVAVAVRVHQPEERVELLLLHVHPRQQYGDAQLGNLDGTAPVDIQLREHAAVVVDRLATQRPYSTTDSQHVSQHIRRPTHNKQANPENPTSAHSSPLLSPLPMDFHPTPPPCSLSPRRGAVRF